MSVVHNLCTRGQNGARRVLWAAEAMVARQILRMQGVRVLGDLTISGLPFIVNLGEIELGDGVKLTSSRANPVGGHARTSLVVQRSGTLVIGAGVGMSNCEIYCTQRVEVGAGSIIGGGARIYDTDFHSLTASGRRQRPDRGVRAAPVTIGEECFIGAFATVLKGATVGARSVIGAGAVVSGNVPADEVWAGNPARLVKRLSG